MITWLKNWWNKKEYDQAADSLEKYEQMKDADFLAKLSDKKLKKFFLALTVQGQKTLKQLDFVAKEINKRGLK